MEVGYVTVRYAIKQYLLQRGAEIPLGRDKRLEKLERKVRELEAKVEQLQKKTNDSRAFQAASWTLVILEIAVAVIAIIGSLLG